MKLIITIITILAYLSIYALTPFVWRIYIEEFNFTDGQMAPIVLLLIIVYIGGLAGVLYLLESFYTKSK